MSMPWRRRVPMRLLLVAVALVGRPATAEPPRAGDRPRLVVLISVDQLRADYLDRFGPRLRSGAGAGFLRLAREGASWANCRHRHAPTATGPGHAAIGSGTYGAV